MQNQAPQRSEPRILKQAPVRIFGMDSKGQPVNLAAATVDVSKHGARLTGVRGWDRPGEVVGVRYGAEKARYRIVWVGGPHSAVDTQVGLVCVDVGRYIWDFVVPASTPLERLGPELGNPLQGANRPGAAFGIDRRLGPRLQLRGGAHVRELGKNVPQWAVVRDLSMGGCYLETSAPLPEHTLVEVMIQVADFRIEARGVVTISQPLIGMAIRFSELPPEVRERLSLLLETQKSETGTTGF